MPPHLPLSKMENSNQSVSHSPQLSAQGYNHQLQTTMWTGNKVCQNTVSQNTNMETYSQHMNHYYQGQYPSQQNTNDMNRYVPSVAKNQNSSSASSYSPQYPMVRQNNYHSVNPNYHHTAVKNNCGGNVYYGSMNSPNSFSQSNVIQSPKKYANSSLGLSQAPQGVPQNSQASGTSLPQTPHYSEQSNYNVQNAYINNYNMHSGEHQQTYVVRQQLSSPSTVMPTPDVPPVHSVTMGSTNQVSQVSSIPTPPETSSLPSDGVPSTDTMSMDSSTDSMKISISSPSFVLPGSTVNHMTPNMSTSMPTMTNNVTMANRTAGNSLQPPANLDEGSQASSASASSSIPDEQNSAKTNSKPNFSYPPTPNTLSSPGAASMSSFHDDLECISSPGWPKTPASPVANSNYEFANIKRPENLLKLYSLSDEPDRRYFLDKLIVFNEDRGSPITQCPTISKQPLDVFRVYVTVKDRGGFVEVTNAKRWKDIAGAIGVGASSSAAYTLRKQYMKLLLPFECKFDRGGIDPQPIINMVEASSRKKGKNSPSSSYGNQNHCNQGYPQAVDGYHAPNYPGPYPNARYHCNSNSADYQCSSGTMHYPQSAHHSSPSHGQSQYNQYSHNSQAEYGYYQGRNASPAPMYNNNMQTSSVNAMCRYSNNATSSSVPPDQGYYSHQYAAQQGQSSQENTYSNRCSAQDNITQPTLTTKATAEPEQHLSSCSTYETPSSATNTATQVPAENIQPKPSSESFQATNTNGTSVSESTADSTRDANTCYSSSYAINKATPRDQEVVIAKSCGPVTCSSPYQQPAAENHSNKAPEVNYYNNTSASHQSVATNYPQSPYQNQKPPYQAGYQQCKDQTQGSQYGHYTQSQNETYQGSDGPTVLPVDRSRCASNEALNSSPKPYQYNCGPPKANMYPYTAPQIANKDPYNTPPYREQFNSRPPRGWMPEQHQYPYQQTSGQRAQMNSQVNPPDVKQGADSPKMQKPWIGPCDAAQVQIRPHASVPGSMQNQNSLPNKLQQHPNSMAGPHSFQPMIKRPLEFPPNTVESVRPVAVKRRRCPAKRVGPVEAWRLMLALKSGLLGESTWALDALSIFLCDSSSVVYFGLSHLPGLIGVLVEHYRCFLNKIFHLADDLEISQSDPINEIIKQEKSDATEGENVKIPNGLCKSRTSDNYSWLEKTKVLDVCNYTYKTRCKKKVEIQYDEALFLIDPQRSWDKYEGFEVTADHWLKGGGDTTMHIQTAFDCASKKVKFSRNLDDEKAKQEIKKSLSLVKVKSFPPTLKEKDNLLKSSLLSCKGEPIVVLQKCNLVNEKVHACSETEAEYEVEVEDKSTTGDKRLRKHTVLTKEEVDEIMNSSDSIETDAKIDAIESRLFQMSSKVPDEDSSSLLICKSESIEIKKDIGDEDEEKAVSAVDKNSVFESETVSDTKSCRYETKSYDEADESFPRLRGSLSSRKRFLCEELEDEAYCFDQPALCVINESQEMLSRRCACISTILRNLSFVPGNDLEMKKSPGFLLLLGRILLLHHEHKPAKPAYRKYEKEADGNVNWEDSCISLKDEHEWWWSTLHVLRDNTLVTLSNISGQLDLSPFPEEVSLPILDGLLHWVVCPSSYAQDPLPSQPTSSVLSPQRLSLEALCKLSILASNVDLIIAMPPWSRIESLFAFLTKSLSHGQDQIMREFAIILLSNISQADTIAARTIAEQSRCISYLIGFIEEAEANAFQIASSQGTKKLRDKPELMGTTPGMVQRAANTLKNLALVPENQGLFVRHQQRLLSLVTSQVMEQELAAIIADVLFYCSDEVTEEISCQLPIS